jgi:hypothetical protein
MFVTCVSVFSSVEKGKCTYFNTRITGRPLSTYSTKDTSWENVYEGKEFSSVRYLTRELVGRGGDACDSSNLGYRDWENHSSGNRLARPHLNNQAEYAGVSQLCGKYR